MLVDWLRLTQHAAIYTLIKDFDEIADPEIAGKWALSAHA
jgi:hypothetical protein